MNSHTDFDAVRGTDSEESLEAPVPISWQERDLHRGPVRHARDGDDSDEGSDEKREQKACNCATNSEAVQTANDAGHDRCG